MCRWFLLAVAIAACSSDGPRVVPSVMDVDAQGPLRIEGLSPDEFLTVVDDRVGLAADYHAELGSITTSVTSAEPGGTTVVTDTPLAIGTYSLTVTANAHVWTVEDALSVVANIPGVDAAVDARVCPAAPTGCTAFTCSGSASCYYVCAATTYTNAKSQCAAKNLGCLVTIGDAAENQCVAAATTPVFPDLVWIGYQQAAGAAEPAGGWDWTCPDGSSFVAPNWGQFEPNDQQGEDCGVMGADGAWIDGDCATSMRFACELP